MITSKDVFAKRKEGAIDEAYRMALELMGSPNADDWDRKSFCWCLIDIIKRGAANGETENLTHYRKQLESIKVDPSDDVLSKSIRNALSLCNLNYREIIQATSLSKDGRHAEAIATYRKALASSPADRESHTGFGWELYKHSKELMAAEHINLGTVKRNLNDYLKLDIEKPSLLHSCILQLAAKLAGQDTFSMLIFSRLWDLKYLRPEDFERFHTKDGKEYPSLAEKVIQQAGKEAAKSENSQEKKRFIPHLDAAIERFSDNIWLKLDKAKILISLGMNDKALAFGLDIAKAKPNDYWAWGLLGDIVSQTDAEASLGCYCKALSCPTDDKFTGKIRLKVAQYMLDSNNLSAAKLEIETVVRVKESEGHKIPQDVVEIVSQPWFTETLSNSSNRDFYNSKISAAEALLFGSLPWVDACIGEKYNILDKDGKSKQKRKILLKISSIPLEVSIPESKFGRNKFSVGDAIKVKCELEGGKIFKLYMLEKRISSKKWDVFSEKIGIIDHLNHSKGILHYIVSREIQGIIPISESNTSFIEGDAIALQLSRYISKNGTAYKVHQVMASDKQPSSDIRREFCEVISLSNNMGFTECDVFIAPPLVSKHQLEDGQQVSGIAVLSFNKKRSNWGWRAISIA